jgi:hypothetical protein
MLAHKRVQLRRLPACLPDNLKPRALKQARDTLAENNVVLRQRDASWACGHGYDY